MFETYSEILVMSFYQKKFVDTEMGLFVFFSESIY